MASIEEEQEWAKFAREMGYYDFHKLDECDCGGQMDCWTKEWEGEYYKFSSEWICEKCGETEWKYYDKDMNEI